MGGRFEPIWRTSSGADGAPPTIPFKPSLATRLENVLTSVLFAVISYFMFTKLLGVNLPPGILPF